MHGLLPWLFACSLWAVWATNKQPEILAPTLKPQHHQLCQPLTFCVLSWAACQTRPTASTAGRTTSWNLITTRKEMNYFWSVLREYRWTVDKLNILLHGHNKGRSLTCKFSKLQKTIITKKTAVTGIIFRFFLYSLLISLAKNSSHCICTWGDALWAAPSSQPGHWLSIYTQQVRAVTGKCANLTKQKKSSNRSSWHWLF